MNPEEIETRLSELIALPVGWDSYHAACQPVNPSTAERARRLIKRIGVPPDNVVPIGSCGPGGSWVQIEWYPDGRYLEIEVDPSGGFNYLAAAWQGPGHRKMDKMRDSLSFTGAVRAARLALMATLVA